MQRDSSERAGFDPEMRKGTSETVVLAVLRDAELHGYGIIKALREISRERFRMNEGALYPLLHRLEREKKLTSRMATVGGRSRKTYCITSLGCEALADNEKSWNDYADFMKRVLDRAETTPDPAGSEDSQEDEA